MEIGIISLKLLEGYHYMITQQLKPSLGNIKISKLHPSHLQEYYSLKLVNGKIDGEGRLSPQSVKHHHREIHKVLKDAIKWKLIEIN